MRKDWGTVRLVFCLTLAVWLSTGAIQVLARAPSQVSGCRHSSTGATTPGVRVVTCPSPDGSVADAGPSAGPGSVTNFVDSTEARGLHHKKTITWGATWLDHDGDRDPDLFANRHWLLPRYYMNEIDRYSLGEETFHSGPHRVFDRHTCSWGEANGDAVPDLYCASGAQKGRGTGANQLWIQKQDAFDNRSRMYGTRDPKGRSRTVNWIDFDGDGDLDIFVGNKRRRVAPNAMLRNDRGTFERVEVGLAARMNTLASTWADWDRDGDPDLLVLRYSPRKAIAYRNEAGTFRKISVKGVTARHWTSASWADYDGDGWVDVHLVGPRSEVVMRNVVGEFEAVHSRSLRAGASSAWIDVENDGDLDLFVVQGRSEGLNRPDRLLIEDDGFHSVSVPVLRGPGVGSGEAVSVADGDLDGRLDLFVTNGAALSEDSGVAGTWRLFENQSLAGNWITVQMRGDPWNPWGYGARLHVQAGDTDYWRYINDGMSLRAQSGVGLIHLGIAGADRVEITVAWPGGERDCLIAGAEQVVTVEIGGAPCS